MPLISCIMPTFNRRRFVPAAVDHFLRQDWPDKELVVVDDGADCVRDLLPEADPRFVYVRLDARATIGRKRNVACERARGEIVAHWDDDDWQAGDRLRRQAEALLASTAELCGITRLLFCNPDEGRAWEFVYLGGAPWVGGSTMMYRRSAWARTPFPDCDVGEDARFAAARSRQQIVVMAQSDFHVGRIHAANVTPKVALGPAWRALPIERIRELLGRDWDPFVRPEGRLEAGSAPSRSVPLVSCIMPTANRRAFVALALEHFRAQDYRPAELIVVDSGDDAVADLCAGAAGVRYVRAARGASIGSQRNMACVEATGEIIVHWDDDDWYGPQRLRRQVEPIASGRADVTGLESRYVWNLTDGSFWTLSEELHRRMFVGNVHGGTLAYRRALLGRGLRYDDISLAEDAALLTRMIGSGARLERVANEGAFVYVRHGRNAWRFDAGTFLGARGWARTDPPPGMSARTVDRYRAIVSPPPPTATVTHSSDEYVDCLGATAIAWPRVPLRFDRCVAVVASGDYADYLDGALTSLARYGAIPDVPRVVLVEAGASRCEQVAGRHGAHVVRWRSLLGRAGPPVKGALYSITRAVEAEQYLCLDADVLVLDSVAPVFAMHAALQSDRVLISPEAVKHPVANLRQGLQSVYLATPAETDRLLAAVPNAELEATVVNDGVFVAGSRALAAVDGHLRGLPVVTQWVSARRDVWWRQKAALNLALAHTRAIAPLDSAYNAQLHIEAAVPSSGRPGAVWRGTAAKLLHFNGAGRRAYPLWRASLLGTG
jgi:glycosyltransferase involved in cell wall biosynthesis